MVSSAELRVLELHKVWRTARREGWTRGCVNFTVGWRATPPRGRADLARIIGAQAGWRSADLEDYLPEDDPQTFLAHQTIERPTLRALEQQLCWAEQTAVACSATIYSLGLGVA
jgi:hypothetical protein